MDLTSDSKAPEGRKNLSPRRKPWVGDQFSIEPRRGDRVIEDPHQFSSFAPLGLEALPIVYPRLAPWATNLSRLRRYVGKFTSHFSVTVH